MRGTYACAVASLECLIQSINSGPAAEAAGVGQGIGVLPYLMQVIVWDLGCCKRRGMGLIVLQRSGAGWPMTARFIYRRAAGWSKCAVSGCNENCCPIKVYRRRIAFFQTLGTGSSPRCTLSARCYSTKKESTLSKPWSLFSIPVAPLPIALQPPSMKILNLA